MNIKKKVIDLGWLNELKSIMNPDYNDYEDDGGTEEQTPQDESNGRGRKKRGENEFSLHATTQLSVVLCRPRVFEDVSGIVDQFRSKRTIIINLEEVDAQLSRRVLDFLAGAAFMSSGKLTGIATSTYMLLPYNLELADDTLSELEAQSF